MKSLRMLGFFALIAALSTVTLNAQSEAMLSGRIGTVEIQRSGAWMEAQTGEQISVGDRIRTATGSSAAVDLGPGKVVTLAANTQIELRESGGSLSARLERGNMKVVSASDLQVSGRDTTPEGAPRTVEIDLGSLADSVNLTVNPGAGTGPIVSRGSEDSARRTSAAGGNGNSPMFGNTFANSNIPENVYG